MGLDTQLNLFPVANVAEYIKSYKHYEAYIKKSYTLTNMSKTEQFKYKMKWIDWYPTLINLLR